MEITENSLNKWIFPNSKVAFSINKLFLSAMKPLYLKILLFL